MRVWQYHQWQFYLCIFNWQCHQNDDFIYAVTLVHTRLMIKKFRNKNTMVLVSIQFLSVLYCRTRLKKFIKVHWPTMTRITQVWVLSRSVRFVVLSSLPTMFVLKDLRSLVQGLGPTFPLDLVYICAYLGCTQVCSGSSCTTHMDRTS